MDTMSKSMDSLVVRLNHLEKGLPSQRMVSSMNQPPPRPNTASTAPAPAFRPVLLPTPIAVSSVPVWPSVNSRPGPIPTRSEPTSGRPAPIRPSATRRPEASTTRTEPLLQSENPDFTQICKTLNRQVQLRRHLNSWTTLPASIDRNIQHVAKNIRPVQPSDELTRDISTIFSQAGTDLQKRIQLHFTTCLTSNLTILRQSNPLDKERAVEIVVKQLKYRLGNKVTEPALRKMVEDEAKVIGADDLHSFRAPARPLKKPCHVTTPPTTTVSNSFSVLSTLEEGDADLEPDSPSPLRKSSRRLPPVPSVSRTPVSFTPSKPSTSGIPRPPTTPPRNTTPISMVLETSPPPSSPSAPPQSIPTTSISRSPMAPRYTLHSCVGKELWKVDLRPDTRHLIISDSNFKHLNSDDIPSGFQLESFSGANFINALKLIEDLPAGQLDNLIISIGINHKDDDFTSRTLPAMDLLLEACGDKIKNLPVSAVCISINPRFRQSLKDNLNLINRKLREICFNSYISPLPDHEIITDRDGVHYTRETQLMILQKIIQYTNETPKN